MASSRKPGLDEPGSNSGLLQHTRQLLAGYLKPGSRLCLGYSGGLDSSVLLHLLAQLHSEMGFSLSALHVNHGLSAQAGAWAEHCHATCTALGIPLELENVQVNRSGTGLEAAAREARYSAFAHQKVDYILLAHHQDDQVETFFLRALRGGGPRGLAGMSRAGVRNGVHLLRPLLDFPRSALEQYAAYHGLSYVQDESNLDLGLTRNFLRLNWLPAVESRMPGYRQIVAREVAHQAECSHLLDDLARLDAGAMPDFTHPDLALLDQLGYERGKNLLRYWLRQQANVTPSAPQLEVLWHQMMMARQDAEPIWRHAKYEVRRYRGRLHLLQTRDAQEAPVSIAWSGLEQLEWPLGGTLCQEKTQGAGISSVLLAESEAYFVGRRGGECLRPRCKGPERSLKKWLQESDIPPWQRARLPILLLNGIPAWVPGMGVDCQFQARPGEAGWLISWQSPL